jgi:hypothetical protein
MAFKRLIFAAFAAGIFLATFSAARADSVFLLQLGSFPTEDEANQKWNDLKSKHSDILSGLALRIAQVALPPDNTIIYRTQAGPLESRADASGMCQKLATTKDECFVVETAMFIGDEDVAAIAPSPSQAVPAPSPDVTLPALVPAPPLASLPDALPPAFEAPAPAPTLAENPAEPIPQVPTSLPEVTTNSLPEPVELVPEQPVLEPKKPETIAAISQSNPIRRTDEGKVNIPSAKKMSKKQVTPRKPHIIVSRPETDTLRAVRPIHQDKIIRSDRPGFLPNLSTSQAPEPAGIASIQPQPNNAFDMQQNVTNISNAPRDLVEAAPALVETITPPPAISESSSQVVVNETINNVANNRGVEVNVAEAIRVPLSGAQSVQPAPAPRVVTREPGVGGYPSYNPEFRTLWAQINYFPDQQTALAFWDEYRYRNAESTRAVRVRITQPYYFARSGRVSLRMGPFAELDDVRNLCAAATSTGRDLKCALVKDMGSSASAATPRGTSNYRGYEEGKRLQNWNMSPDAPANWVQLGSYPTPDRAWGEWERIKNDHVDLLGKVGADVNTANMSSSAKQVFRLRVGPFMTKMGARLLCEKLEYRGVSCIVVGRK